MSRWEDLPWNERILKLDLKVEEKSDATALILRMPPIDREIAVPKDKAVAIDSIRKRLKASCELRILHACLCLMSLGSGLHAKCS